MSTLGPYCRPAAWSATNCWVPDRIAVSALSPAGSRESLGEPAVHPWDIHGAHQAGLRTGWITRQHTPYPGYFAAPDLQAPDMVTLAGQIVA